jgi:heme exporter protein A
MSIHPSNVSIDRIKIRSLKKRFGYARALAGVDLDFQSGSLSTLLGPNGAGKSTLLGILSTLIRPSGGSVEYVSGGKPLQAGRDLRRHLGVLAHQSFVYGDSMPSKISLFGQNYTI